MKNFIISVAIASVAIGLMVWGFSKLPPLPKPNYPERQELFFKCLDRIPEGPKSIGNYNDWNEVVAECRKSATYLSKDL